MNTDFLSSLGIPHPEVGQPLLSFVHGQGCVESQVICIAILQEIVEQHCTALTWLNLNTQVNTTVTLMNALMLIHADTDTYE